MSPRRDSKLARVRLARVSPNVIRSSCGKEHKQKTQTKTYYAALVGGEEKYFPCLSQKSCPARSERRHFLSGKPLCLNFVHHKSFYSTFVAKFFAGVQCRLVGRNNGLLFQRKFQKFCVKKNFFFYLRGFNKYGKLLVGI